MIVTDKMLSMMRLAKSIGWEKVEQWNKILDDESVRRWIADIQKTDGVSYEEAWNLCLTDPKYSMGLKMCSPAIMMMLKMPGGVERFRKMLTPEELEIFDSEVNGKINFRQAIRKEKRRQQKKKKGSA